MNVYERMEQLGIILPDPPPKGGVYSQIRKLGDNFVYVSGCGCYIEGGENYTGKLGTELTISQGKVAARQSMLNVLAVLNYHIGDLEKISSFVKLLVFVSSGDDFYNQPEIANGASTLLVDIFGEKIGLHARSAIGCNTLPGNTSVEIEVLLQLSN